MKHHHHIALFLGVLFVFIWVKPLHVARAPESHHIQEADYRKIAWNSLNQQEKEDVIGPWKQGEMRLNYLDKRRFTITDPAFADNDFYTVSFHTHSEKTSSLGIIMVLVDRKTKKVVGHATRS